MTVFSRPRAQRMPGVLPVRRRAVAAPAAVARATGPDGWKPHSSVCSNPIRVRATPFPVKVDGRTVLTRLPDIFRGCGECAGCRERRARIEAARKRRR